MADDSLSLFEFFIKMRNDLAEGRFFDLKRDSKTYSTLMADTALKYARQFAFGKVPYGDPANINLQYFNSFYKATYEDAARIATENSLLSPVIRRFRYRVDRDGNGETARWHAVDYADDEWPTTDVCHETWSSIGLHNYMGKLWYRTTIDVAKIEPGQPIYLWLGATDGSAKVFVNGTHIPYIDAKKNQSDVFRGYAAPASFDITAAVRAGKVNTIAMLCCRDFLNEVGSGGLLAPIVIYSVKQ
jgi:hypothetical protein